MGNSVRLTVVLYFWLSLALLFSPACAWSLGSDVDESFAPDPLKENQPLSLPASYLYPDERVLIGGRFNFAQGQVGTNLIRLNADGTPDTTFTSPIGLSLGIVLSVDLQSNGKIIVGGSLTNVRNPDSDTDFSAQVMRLEDDGTVDTSFTVSDAYSAAQVVEVLANDKIMVGFGFAPYLIRLNADGTLDNTFVDLQLNNDVRDIKEASNGDIYIAGDFTEVGGEAHHLIARLNADGTLDSDFATPNYEPSGRIYSLYLPAGGNVIAVGQFSAIKPNPDAYFWSSEIMFSDTGAVVETFRPRVSYLPLGVVQDSSGRYVFAGRMNEFSSGSTIVQQFGAIRLNSDLSLDSTFQPGIDQDRPSDLLQDHQIDSVHLLANDKLLLIGDFSINSEGRRNIVRLNADGSVDTSYLASEVYSKGQAFGLAVQSNNKVLVSGNFQTPDQRSWPNGIQRLNTDGSFDASFSNPRATGTIYAIEPLSNGKIMIGGDFTRIGGFDGTPQAHLARLNADGSLDETFTVEANASVRKILELSNGEILVAGFFDSVGGQTRRGIAKLNSDGSLNTDFDAQLTETSGGVNVQDMQVVNNKLFIGGKFRAVAGTFRVNIAKLNLDGSLDTSFEDTQINASVSGIAVTQSGEVFAGGSFNYSVEGVNTLYTIKLDNLGNRDASYDAPELDGFPVQGIVIQPNGKIIIHGFFSLVNGEPRLVLARLNPDGSLDSEFDADMDDLVNNAIMLKDGTLLIAGRFQLAGGALRGGIAKLLGQSEDPNLNSEMCFPIPAKSGGVAIVCL